jgi:hypothetical protein
MKKNSDKPPIRLVSTIYTYTSVTTYFTRSKIDNVQKIYRSNVTFSKDL